jgi:predicted nuclease of restriction endonuclease-like RecB superfamily
MRKSSKFYSRIGRKGAEIFWNKFYSDPQFQEKMRNSWKGHRVNPEKIVEAAKLGYEAFKQRYDNDVEFKRKMDEKLAVSRSKGGSISLRNLGENGFKERFAKMKNELLRYKYTDNQGNKLRSRQELKVANFLSSKGISFTVEPKFTCGYHNYYPDFLIQGNKQKIIEVMGVGTKEYWENAKQKISSLTEHYPEMEILIITSYSKKAKTHLSGIARVNILIWRELEKVANWCWENAPG